MTDTMAEEQVFIVRAGEATLKGQNKSYFEKMLVERIAKLLRRFDGVKIERKEGLVFVRAPLDVPEEDILKQIHKVFGVASVSPAVEVDPNMDAIAEGAVAYMLDLLDKQDIKTFKVEANRSDKSFPVTSPEIARPCASNAMAGTSTPVKTWRSASWSAVSGARVAA